MSVSDSFVLPGVPAIGTVELIPLGGDGMSAPHSCYTVSFFEVAADASAGTAQLTVTLDDRYCSLIGWATAFIDGTNTSQVVRMQITGAGTPAIIDNITLDGFAEQSDVSKIWYPPTWVLPGATRVCSIRFTCKNTDGDDPTLSFVVYNFHIQARELTNIGFLGYARGPTP